MNKQPVSEEKLNAFIDQQLSSEDRAEVLAQLRLQPELAQQTTDLQELKEWVRMAYQDPPGLNVKTGLLSHKVRTRYQMLAASILIILSGLVGWFLHGEGNLSNLPSFHDIAQAESAVQSNRKILIHISKMDKERITLALDKAEQILGNSKKQDKPLQLEIVANAQGLALLRDGSPFTERIESITRQYDNIAFLACGIAMQNVRLSEGINEVKLLPQAQQIDAALEQILRRLKAGWAYVRG